MSDCRRRSICGLGGYENAPGTSLVATRCASCQTELLNAESVERGVGPKCAKRYGYGKASRPPDLATAAMHASRAKLEPGLKLIHANNCYGAANWFVHWVAANRTHPQALDAVQAIRACGYPKLGDAIWKKLRVVEIAQEGGYFRVKAPFDECFVEARRAIPGAYWHNATKTDMIPVAREEELWSALQRCHAGRLGYGRVGPFKIPPR